MHDGCHVHPKSVGHFNNPRNVGKMDDADAVGIAGNPKDGDTTYVYIKVQDDVIAEITFQTMGCAAAIASSSMLTELAKGLFVKPVKLLGWSRRGMKNRADRPCNIGNCIARLHDHLHVIELEHVGINPA